MKGAERNALFVKHDFNNLMTGWSLDNVSLEDSGYEAIRFTGTFGTQGFGLNGCTFENNARSLAVGTTSYVEGIRRRKAQIFSDAPYMVGLDINRTTFYNNDGGGTGGNPDWHVYISAVDNSNNPVVTTGGEIRNSRFLLAQPTGGAVIWPIGCLYRASNLGVGQAVTIDRSAGSMNEAEALTWTSYNPTVTFGGNSAGQSGSGLRVGRYQVVGRAVHVALRITMGGNKGTSTGTVAVSLPIPVVNFTNQPIVFTVLADQLTGTAITQLVAEAAPGASTAELYRYENGTRSAVTDAQFGHFTNLTLTGVYPI